MLVLGSSGSKNQHSNVTSFLVTPKIVIDAGNLINGLGDEFLHIEHILITHTHFDHIADLPLVLDNYFTKIKQPITIHATKESIQNLKDHIFNHKIWPDFSTIPLINSSESLIRYEKIEYDEIFTIEGVEFYPFVNNHMKGSCGFIINEELMITSDTYKCQRIWELLEQNPTIDKLITEISFASNQEKLAQLSKHFTPKLLHEQMQQYLHRDIKLYLHHLKQSDRDKIVSELKSYGFAYEILEDNQKIPMQSLHCGDESIGVCDIADMEKSALQKRVQELSLHIKSLNKIAVALSCQRNFEKLLEMILQQAKEFTAADAGTLYMLNEKKQTLEFKSVITDSLGIKMGGSKEAITWDPLPLYDANAQPNKMMVAVKAALEGQVINIADVYESKEFNFSGTKAFDNSTGYVSKSMLVVPMKNHEDKVIGVFQLINRQNKKGQITHFDSADEFALKALASQAAVSITNTNLINSLEELLDSFIKSIAAAIDAKSPYTGDHVKKVAHFTDMIAKKIDSCQSGTFRDVSFNKQQLRELHIAALMHDVGKIATPTHIMDKATKLETIFDRIEVIRLRFALYLSQKRLQILEQGGDSKQLEAIEQEVAHDLEFLAQVNIGGEFMSEQKIARVKDIATKKVTIEGQKINILTDDEVKNLCIVKGTLTPKQMQVMHDHASLSDAILSQLPFPKKLQKVPEIASRHHEKLNGKGYPHGLSAKDLSLESRLLAVADIFEALSASDRPYKKAKKMSEIEKILAYMVKDGEIDGDIVAFIYEHKLHLEYAKHYFSAHQLDTNS
ncbi:MAG: HD domain-containing phosphohydrolase [Campylobacterota bacterium]